MKKRILRITILLSMIGAVFYFNGGLEKFLKSPTVVAFGDLIVDFHVPVGDPIFSLLNMKPGDVEERPVDVRNDSLEDKFIAVKGVRTAGAGLDPRLETVLDVVIKDGATPLYGSGSPTGPKTMLNFFTDSTTTNGVPLNTLNDGDDKTYNFFVGFPSFAGDEFQAKSVIADIRFGTITADHLVIQEVFYNVDNRHGLKERKHNDERDEDEYERRYGVKDWGHYHKKRKTRLKFQWIELYNPTNQDISLKNWRIYNNSGRYVKITANKKIKAHGFALISKDSSVWRFWNEPRSALKIEIGSHFGDGFDIDGDRAILKRPGGAEVDRMSWGSDTSGFTPPAVNPKVPKGHSTERRADGFDTDAASDWLDQNSPTPGD